MNAPAVQHLLRLWLTHLRTNGESGEIASSYLLKLLRDCGLSYGEAKRLVCQRLCAVRDTLNLNQTDNEYFRLLAGGRLDATHLSKVFIKSDGINEIMLQGNHALNIQVRALALDLFHIVEEQIDKAHRYEQEHKLHEQERRRSNKTLQDKIQQLLLCNDRSAQGRVRAFANKKYDAMGVIDRTDPAFRTAKTALRTVATNAQLARRRSTDVSDNLTIAGKYVDLYMNTVVANDLTRPALLEQLNASPSQATKRQLVTNALNERVTRLKRFHCFHVDPAMIGQDSEQGLAQFDASEQANCFLNQEADKLAFA
jgi:hypothetical protein